MAGLILLGLASAFAVVLFALFAAKWLDASTSGEQYVDLEKALLWPAFAVFAIVVFAAPLSDMLWRIKGFKISPKDGAVSLETFDVRAKRAATHLREAAVEKNPEAAALAAARPTYDSIRATVNARTEPIFEASRILWVDDHPVNNLEEIDALRALGITIDTVCSSDEAQVASRLRRYDVAITDMGRPEGRYAGFEVAELMRPRGIPVIVYTSPNNVESLQKLAPSARGVFVTASPYELFDLVTNALVTSARAGHGPA